MERLSLHGAGVVSERSAVGRLEEAVSPWQPRLSRSVFGDAVILAFLAAQAADGMFTYVGVSTLGMRLEANPLVLALITSLGLGTAVTTAKVFVAILGVSLHRLGVHGILAALTGIYVIAALVPWFSIFMMQL